MSQGGFYYCQVRKSSICFNTALLCLNPSTLCVHTVFAFCNILKNMAGAWDSKYKWNFLNGLLLAWQKAESEIVLFIMTNVLYLKMANMRRMKEGLWCAIWPASEYTCCHYMYELSALGHHHRLKHFCHSQYIQTQKTPFGVAGWHTKCMLLSLSTKTTLWG